MSREEYFDKKVRINKIKLEKLKKESKKNGVSIARQLDLILEDRYEQRRI